MLAENFDALWRYCAYLGLAARLARSLIRIKDEKIDRAGGKRVDERNPMGYISFMIKSFKHKGLERFFYTGSKKGIRPEHTKKLARILDRLNAAKEIKDMNYPGSFLHRLSGDREGQYSVRVSGNWRMLFEFMDGDAFVVDYGDYH